MSVETLTSKKKVKIILLSTFYIIILSFISDLTQLNQRANNGLIKALNIPSDFIAEIFKGLQQFENDRIAELEDKISALENIIYEKDLVIQSLENSRSFNFPSKNYDGKTDSIIVSFDQLNFNCCNKHRIFVSNPKNLPNHTYSISQGDFVVGKTKEVGDEIEVRLLSDPEEYISIKNSKNFFCIANGNGDPMTIICKNESKAVEYEIGDTFFTTGFDGIYPEGLIVGTLEKISTEKDFFNEILEIKLFFDPFKSINRKVIIYD